MGRHAAPTGDRPAPQAARTASRSAHSHRAHRAPSRRRAVESPDGSRTAPAVAMDPLPDPVPTPVAAAVPAPVPIALPAATHAPLPAPAAQSSRRGTATLERPRPQQIADVVLVPSPEPAPAPVRRATRAPRNRRKPSLGTRVAALPRVLLETVAWGGFAAVVALIVIALSDVEIGRAALWAAGLGGIVVLAVGVMALTGTHLVELDSSDGVAGSPD